MARNDAEKAPLSWASIYVFHIRVPRSQRREILARHIASSHGFAEQVDGGRQSRADTRHDDEYPRESTRPFHRAIHPQVDLWPRRWSTRTRDQLTLVAALLVRPTPRWC